MPAEKRRVDPGFPVEAEPPAESLGAASRISKSEPEVISPTRAKAMGPAAGPVPAPLNSASKAARLSGVTVITKRLWDSENSLTTEGNAPEAPASTGSAAR